MSKICAACGIPCKAGSEHWTPDLEFCGVIVSNSANDNVQTGDWLKDLRVILEIDSRSYQAFSDAMGRVQDDLDFARAKPADAQVVEPLYLEDKQCES